MKAVIKSDYSNKYLIDVEMRDPYGIVHTPVWGERERAKVYETVDSAKAVANMFNNAVVIPERI